MDARAGCGAGWVRGKGESELALRLRHGGWKLVKSGGHGQIAAWELSSYGCSTSIDRADRRKEGEGGFSSGNPPKGCIKAFGAYECFSIVGEWCAITHEACVSHGCNAFCVGKGNEWAYTGVKYMYIGANKCYLW